MATSDTSYPKIPEGSWWKLREQIARKMPATLTASFVASALNMGENSARANIISSLKRIGLIDEQGKPTDLTNEWRIDESYPEVCRKIVERTYPDELRSLYHDVEQDQSILVNWFLKTTRKGEAAAKQYANFYRLLLRANPAEQASSSQPSSGKTTKSNSSKSAKVSAPGSKVQRDSTTASNKSDNLLAGSDDTLTNAKPSGIRVSNLPQLHINIQLHISPETSAEQIDRIFESMAKHLKNFASDQV